MWYCKEVSPDGVSSKRVLGSQSTRKLQLMPGMTSQNLLYMLKNVLKKHKRWGVGETTNRRLASKKVMHKIESMFMRI